MSLTRRLSLFFAWFLLLGSSVFAQYSNIFDYSKALRIDFVLGGINPVPFAGLVALNEEPYWSGIPREDIMKMDYGNYVAEVYEQNELVFKRGFNSLYEEWLSTKLLNVGPFAFEHSLNIPYPIEPVLVKLFARQGDSLIPFAAWDIDPKGKIVKPYHARKNAEKHLLYGDGEYKKKLDLCFVADGYTQSEKEKALADVNRFASFLVSQQPFNLFVDDINCWLVFEASSESGVTEPLQNIYKNTLLNSSFNTLGLKRYLSVERYFTLRNIAAFAPYDFVLVMSNTSRYGGGGIFNHFSVFSANGSSAERVFLHEFGHHFGGLADEYFNTEVPYENINKLSVEPWEPNVTTLVDFQSKWAEMVNDSLPVPTPRNEKYENVVGVFEGGLYVSKGVYSPAMNCRMKSNEADGFCAVCQTAIIRMLKMYIAD